MNNKLIIITKWLGILLLIGFLIYVINTMEILHNCTPEKVKNYVHSFGSWAPIVYIILFTLVPLTLFPDSILAIAGGMCFGLVGGYFLTLIGALCGGTLSFYLARKFGQGFIKKLVKKDMTRLEDAMTKRGFFIVFLLRLIPLFPFDVISYCAGFAGVKFKDFMLATILGTIPGIFVFVNVGDKSTEIGSSNFYISIALLVGLIVGSFIIKNKFSLDNINKSSNENSDINIVENNNSFESSN